MATPQDKLSLSPERKVHRRQSRERESSRAVTVCRHTRHDADAPAALTADLDRSNAIHVGHSTGGGEVPHDLARHGESREIVRRVR